jgi:hypothetical protein
MNFILSKLLLSVALLDVEHCMCSRSFRRLLSMTNWCSIQWQIWFTVFHCPFKPHFIASFVVSWITIYLVRYLLLKDYLV